jgi:REP element-mobilizing transposase RayT
VNFNAWLKTNSRQWIFAGDIDAAIKRAIRDAGEERRINLFEWEASLDHMRLRVGTRDGDHQSRMKQLINGASARLMLRAASDIRLDAGVSHFWQETHGSEAGVPDLPSAVRRYTSPETGGEA